MCDLRRPRPDPDDGPEDDVYNRRRMDRVLVACALSGLAALPFASLQERVLPVPQDVTATGVPPIPMRLVEAVAPYGQFRQARLVSWHPTERRLITATSFGQVPQLHEVRFPGGARRQLTFFGDGVGPRPGAAFTPAGDAIVFQKDTARGGEANQLYRYDFGTGALTMLTDGVSRHGVPVAARHGLVAFDSTRRNGKDRDIYVVEPGSPGTSRLVAQNDGAWSVLDWTPDGRSILALQSRSSSETALWRIDVSSGEKTALTPRDGPPARWAFGAFGSDGRTVYALSNFKGENARIWRLSAGAWTALTPAEQVIESVALSADGRTLAAIEDQGATSRLRLLDAEGGVRKTPSLPPGVIGDLQWHPTRGEVAFSLAGSRAFNDVYSVDAASGRVDRWTFSETGGANMDALPDAEVVTWKSFDGLAISGVLYRPPARFRGPRPVIVNVHGGPAERERPRALGRSNYFRNELGIAVIYPNIRGSSGFGRTFEELDNGRLRENAIKDIGALLDWIAADPNLDESRVMIAGASYGGFVALAAAIEYGHRLRGVNPAFGITDFPSYLESTELSRQANRNAEYGDPADPAMREFLTRISPLRNVSRLTVPTFVAAGARDTRVPVAQAEMLVNALKTTGTPVWYVRFEQAGHLQLTAATNDFAIYTWIMFVERFLLPESRP
jgi:dipeptidyl aminopeptidase/acylaminoacyl peptidase